MLERDQLAKLYELIWTRTSRQPRWRIRRDGADVTVDIVADVPAPSKIRKLDLRATGQVVRFDGFLRALSGRQATTRTTRKA